MSDRKMIRRFGLLATAGAVVWVGLAGLASPAFAVNDYTNSAHGSSTSGVSRAAMATKGYDPGNCAHCHEMHDSVDSGHPAPGDATLDNYLGFLVEQNLCYECHDGAPESDISTQFGKTYKHGGGDMTAYDNRHTANENIPGDFVFANRHAECADCHNPHKATAANPLKGVSGVDPANGVAGTDPGYTFVDSVDDAAQQYKVCFKCHSGWAGFGSGSNAAIAFNPANDSFHHVETDEGYSYTVNTGTGKGIWQNAEFNSAWVDEMMVRSSFSYTDANLRVEPLRCSDCHGPDGADKGASVPEGVHGSLINHILKVPDGSPYDTWNATVDYRNNSGSIWCFNCHSDTFTNTGLWGSGKNLHTSEHDNYACQDCHLAVPHGQTGSGTSNQRKHLLRPDVYREEVDDEPSGNWPQHSSWVIPGCT